MELKVDWFRNMRREEEIRNLVSDVKDLGNQVDVVQEETKALRERGPHTLLQRRVNIEIGFAVCIVINEFVIGHDI